LQETVPDEPERLDAFLVLKNLVLDGLKPNNDIDISKCYIRALIDDDTFCTHFGKGIENQLTWNDAIHLPLKQRNLEETCVYVMVCINTENEISFLDTMVANVRFITVTSVF